MRTRSLLLVVALVVAVSAPVIAYIVYPGEAPAATSREEGVHKAPVFVEALRHGHYYRGVHVLSGVAVKPLVHGFVLDTARGQVIVVLPHCVLVGGKPVPWSAVAKALQGRHVLVRGQVFAAHGLVVVRPTIIVVDGHVLRVRPCPHHSHHIHHHGAHR